MSLVESNRALSQSTETQEMDERVPNSPPKGHSRYESFPSANLSKKNLTTIPRLKESTQQLIASNNNLVRVNVDCVYANLKYLDVSNNRIVQIGREFQRLPRLQTLNINNNRLKKLGRIPQIKCYKASDNPIQKLDTKVCSRLLQSVHFDWMSYMSPTVSTINFQNLTPQLKQLLQMFGPQSQISLKDFLEVLDPIKKVGIQVTGHIYFAINHDNNEFFDYLQDNQHHIASIEESVQHSKSLFEHALIHKSKRALEYFQAHGLKRSSKFHHMHLACRYNHSQLFSVLLAKGFSANCYDQWGNSLLHEVISSFSPKQSPPILMSILKSHYNPNHKNNSQNNCILYAGNKSVANLIEFLRFLQQNNHLAFFFDLGETCGDVYTENILHLGARTGSVELTKLIVDNNWINPFVLNSTRKRPKQLPSLPVIKKYLSKCEKRTVNHILNSRQRIKRCASSLADRQQHNILTTSSTKIIQYRQAKTVKTHQNTTNPEREQHQLYQYIVTNTDVQDIKNRKPKRQPVGKSDLNLLQDYELFHESLGMGYRQNSQSISSLIKFNMTDDTNVSDQTLFKYEPKVIKTHESKMKKMSGVQQIAKRMSTFSCLNV